MFTVSFSSSSQKTTYGSHPPRGAAPGGCPPTPPRSATRASPGTGLQVAWTSWRDGQPEVYTADPEGAGQARLTYWGDNQTRVTGWTQAGEVLAVSAAGQPENQYSWAYAVPLHGAPPRRLPFGPVSDLALETAGTALLTGRDNSSEPAYWKRYRGGTAGKLWIATARRPPVHPDPGRPEHPVQQPDADRRPAVLPVRPRGHREHLLLRPGRHRPGPAHRPRRQVRQEPQHRRAPHRLPRRGRHLDAGRSRGRRTAPGRDHPRLPVRGPRPAPGHRRATTWAAWTATRPGRPAWWRCAARCTG